MSNDVQSLRYVSQICSRSFNVVCLSYLLTLFALAKPKIYRFACGLIYKRDLDSCYNAVKTFDVSIAMFVFSLYFLCPNWFLIHSVNANIAEKHFLARV